MPEADEKQNLKEALEQAENQARKMDQRLRRMELKWPLLLGGVVTLILILLWLFGG